MGTPDPGLLSPWKGFAALGGILSWKVHGPPASGLSLQPPLMPLSASCPQRGLPTGGPGGGPVCPLAVTSLHQAGLVPSQLRGEGQAADGPPPHSCTLFCALGPKLLYLEEEASAPPLLALEAPGARIWPEVAILWASCCGGFSC